MEDTREQPIIMPATALNPADDESAMSEVGSQHDDLGKFKSVQALMDAYNNLQAEFTKKCQKLSELQKDKVEEDVNESIDNIKANDDNSMKNAEINAENIEKSLINDINEENFDEHLNLFLENNSEASNYVEEIKNRFSASDKKSSPIEVAWAEVLLSHLKEGEKVSDPIINQYVLSDENVRNKVIEDYLTSLNNSKPPLIMSSKSGERLSGVMTDSPKTLADAKRLVNKMFS